MLDRFIAEERFPHEPIAVFESKKGPLSFLMLSATPLVMGWLLYHGILDIWSLMSSSGAADMGIGKSL